MNFYTREKNAQVVLALLKAHGIRKVVASPGATNVSLIASMQSDPYFEMYSCVDERSAAYMACGLAFESGEPVVISCTGATAARNYFPGLTEAFYRKLPILAITSTQPICRVGHLVAQVTDRSQKPKDVVKFSVSLPIVKDDEDLWDCEIKVNQAILELTRDGGGPAHINLPTRYDQSFDVKELPNFRVIRRVGSLQGGPPIPKGRIAVFIGSHAPWTPEETAALDAFCAAHNAAVFCDHTSGYRGKFRVLAALIGGQQMPTRGLDADLLIHIGEITGDYYGSRINAKDVWRVNLDGEIRDPFRKLSHVFSMSEKDFLIHYAGTGSTENTEYFQTCRSKLDEVRAKIPELPFSNIWLAAQMAHKIPEGSVIHFGILNSLRAWNFFELPASVSSTSNVGGFGIDGAMSTLVGASLVNPDKLYFGVMGDLAFFYDMNAMGNRHIRPNIRILLVNNGKGTEFRQFGHHAAHFGETADEFIAAAGHFGSKSDDLVKHYAQDLGFEYFSAKDKHSFLQCFERFLNPENVEKGVLFEIFTNSDKESNALERILNTLGSPVHSSRSMGVKLAKRLIGQDRIQKIKGILGT
jgi:2-succinyl-5-enolpyruvyl-6-hydroxy-3-cyclohexene-1-carboxylate synthase